MKLLVFGPGYSASAAIPRLRDHARQITATARSAEAAERLRAMDVRPVTFGAAMSDDLAAAIAEATHLLVSIPPDEEGDPGLRLAADRIAEAPDLRHVIYLSTVGVYGDHGGGWVDEETPPEPNSKRTAARVAAEAEWQGLLERRGLPVAIFRLSGIYGPGRNALVNLAAGTARRIVKPGQIFNRIHVDDIATAIDAACSCELAGILNVTDDLPAPPQDIVAYAADLMGVEPPPEVPFETADLSPMARSFYSQNKGVRNQKLKETLDFTLAYPTYREGLAALWAAGEGRQPKR